MLVGACTLVGLSVRYIVRPVTLLSLFLRFALGLVWAVAGQCLLCCSWVSVSAAFMVDLRDSYTYRGFGV